MSFLGLKEAIGNERDGTDILPEIGVRGLRADVATGDGFEGMGSSLLEVPVLAPVVAAATSGEEVVEPVPPEPTPEPLTGVEAVICGVFVGYCADALAVARCESGPDYYAAPAVYHTGTFQLAFAYHAGKFADRDWDMWASGDDIYQNSVVAFEIFAGRGFSWLGTSGWPVCGWEAGY